MGMDPTKFGRESTSLFMFIILLFDIAGMLRGKSVRASVVPYLCH